MSFPSLRLRRLRTHPVLRDLIRETEVNLSDLILPLFIKGKNGPKVPIVSMPGHFQIPLEKLEQEIEEVVAHGLSAVILFGIPAHKDAMGSDSYSESGIIQEAIAIIKKSAPHLLVISDVCFCEYTDHGHCGVIPAGRVSVDNDLTLELLVKQAICHAKAGADVIAPSGMMDGAVQAIRRGLDHVNFNSIPLLSYSVKYNSSLYGPFREAAEGAPTFGDRASHQMDCANAHEALREVALDIEEGADMVMVKPAHSYLDVIYRIKARYPHVPLGAYHTSGEYAMIKAAAEKGWIDEKKAVSEILGSIRRAGADFIITYFAKEFASYERRL